MTEGNFVESLITLSANDKYLAEKAASLMVCTWESSGAVVIADFEGENMGWGGELTMAQFLATTALDPATLRRSDSVSQGSDREMGLLIDARSTAGVVLIRKVMESKKITKVIWGADGDLISLRHQGCLSAALAPFPAIASVNVIDAQLGFSTVSKRLGMKRMLERVPFGKIRTLPSKDLEDSFYDAFGRNKRCFRLPLTKRLALYAIDDLHRIEAILETQTPPGGSYAAAKRTTDMFLATLDTPSSGVSWLQLEKGYYTRKFGSKRTQKAVQFTRAVRHLEMAFGKELTSHDRRIMESAKHAVAPELRKVGVVIPDTLAFAD